MGSFSEELKNETIDLLLSKPITTLKLVIGKFFAVYFLIIISIIPTLIYPITIYFLGEELGNLDLGAIIGSYIGLLLLSSASLRQAASSGSTPITFVSGLMLFM